jgi:hypothetical protein
VVLNIFVRNAKCYKISIDDGTGVITGVFKLSKETKPESNNFFKST